MKNKGLKQQQHAHKQKQNNQFSTNKNIIIIKSNTDYRINLDLKEMKKQTYQNDVE